MDKARWTILGRPRETRVLEAGAATGHVRRFFAGAGLDRPLSGARPGMVHNADVPPFAGGWIGWLSYDLGRAFEPRAHDTRAREGPHGAEDDRAWPLAVLARCDDAWIHDRVRGVWWRVGSPPSIFDSSAGLAGRTDASSTDAMQLLSRAAMPWTSDTGRAQYVARVGRVLEYIRAGDVYQVNLAHRLTARARVAHRQLAGALWERAGPWMGASIEHADGAGNRAVVSASPELFLSYDPHANRLATRPMKGTRAPGASAGELRKSPKDRAELAMIVDLMRNDLGRVCELGSVRVEQERAIEVHAQGMLQATATVSGTPAPDATWFDALRATFPGGSITGAPKIRAMQIIDELELHRRGPYCGAAGYFSDCGHAALSIAIRTACITGDQIDWWVGAGIVADSVPEREWDETLVKAGVLGALHGVAGVQAGRAE